MSDRKPPTDKTGGNLTVAPAASRKSRKSKQGAGSNRRPTLELMTYVDPKAQVSNANMEFHMTIRLKVTELSPKKASILLSMGVVRALTEGIDFTLYLSLEFLFNYLKKSGYDVLHHPNEKVRQTLLLAELVLAWTRGNWYDFLEREQIPEEIRLKCFATGWVPTSRTIMSWGQFYDLERFLQVRIVPVEQLIKRNDKSTAERYSSYTRGYGNDGRPANPGKTKTNSELDGDATERPPPSFTLQEFDQYIDIINSIEKAKAEKRQNK